MNNVFLVNCFCTNEIGSGNPAAVVKDFIGEDSARQMIARKLKKPVTVFITTSNEDKPSLKFFYPDTQMPLCLHGTLAAAKVLFDSQPKQEIDCSIDNGVDLTILKSKEGYYQTKVFSQKTDPVDVSSETLCRMLNLSSNKQISSNLPLCVASVGSPKLFVPLISIEFLFAVQPNFDLIKKWSAEKNINGLYVYAQDPTHNDYLYARGFNPITGHNEDAATGVAAAALCHVMKRDIKVKQGHSLGMPCQITVTYKSPDEIFVGGKVSEAEALSCEL